jgi:hypothetical protein
VRTTVTITSPGEVLATVAPTPTSVAPAPATSILADGTVTIVGAERPPDAASLPPGAVLYQGSSGDEIGCVPCDGLLRMMSVDHPGVVAASPESEQEIALMSAPLASDGIITHLGMRLSAADGGIWAINVRCMNTSTPGSCGSPTDVAENASAGAIGYAMACNVPIGGLTCVRWDPETGRGVRAGDRLALAIGNPGNPSTAGHFTVDWWFVFQPDA